MLLRKIFPEYSPQRGNPWKGFGPRGGLYSFLMVYCNTHSHYSRPTLNGSIVNPKASKMLLPNQRRIQYKVTFFTREVTFFDGTSATNTIAQGQVSRRVVRISGCGGRMPSTQHIAVTLTPWATWQCAGLRAYVHHSRRKLTLTVPYPKEAKKAV